MITIYTKQHCAACNLAKDYFLANNIEYLEKSIESDNCPSIIKKADIVPVIDVNGTIIYGFNYIRLDRILNIQRKNLDIYLDEAATNKESKLLIEERYNNDINYYANASSPHLLGAMMQSKLSNTRNKIAKILKCKTSEIYFTSGGTEANNWAIKGIADANRDRGNHIIVSKIEHMSVLKSADFLKKKGYKISLLSVDQQGNVDLQELERLINEETILVSIMVANNEIGTIQNIEKIIKVVKEKDIILHMDAVQAINYLPSQYLEMGVDAISLSAHKFNGPKGIGLLCCRETIKITPLIHGGSQQFGLRGGTENVGAIVSMGNALEKSIITLKYREKRIEELRRYFLEQLKNNKIRFQVNGAVGNSLKNILNITFFDCKYQDIISMLSIKGVHASNGSACSIGPNSHVLRAIGLTDSLIEKTVRFSFNENLTKTEIDYTISQIVELLNK